MESVIQKKRIEWIDILKGIAIISVVLGHRVWPDYGVVPTAIKTWIYSFHMPLFFFLSGITFSVEKYKNFGQFLAKKIKTILFPMVVFTVVRILFNYIYYGVLLNNDKYTLSQSINDLIGIICQQRQGTYNSGLWFLTCLFVIEILLYFIINISKNKTHVITVSILVMFLIGVGFSKSTGFLLAWELDVAFISIIFVGTGYLFRNVQSVILERGSLILCVMLLFVNAMTTYLNFNISGKAVDLAVNIIGNPILFLISAYSGIFFLIFLFRNSTKFNILKYIGKNSLVFYGLSDLMMFLPDIVIYNILHIDIPAMGNASVIIGIFYAITVNLIIWPLCWIINKKFSFVLGKF